MNVEWAILADYVELSNNKLYMMGGGWDALTINDPQFLHSFGVAASFRAELDELDRSHEVAIQIVHVESDTTIVDVQGSVEFSEPPESSSLRSELAHFGLNLTIGFQSEGLFHLVVRVENQIRRIVPFHIAFGASQRHIPISAALRTKESETSGSA